MGLDLTVAPIKYGDSDKWWLSYTRISLDRNYELFGMIADKGRDTAKPILQPRLLPDGVKFDWYEGDGIKTRVDDPYGGKLTYVLAGEFLKIQVPSNSGTWNRSVIAFLCSIDPKIPVVLWWH